MFVDDKQYHLQLKKGDVGSYIILPGDPGRCEKIASYFENSFFVASNREYTTYTGTLLGEKVSVVSTGIGGPSAAIAVEELVELGAHTFVRVGTCGGMHPKVKGGDLVIVTGSVRQDGTGREYLPVEFPAVSDFQVTEALKQGAEKLKAPYHLGVVQCKDSFYGQHRPESMPVETELKEKWEAWKRGNCLASEMESATLFLISQVRGTRAGCVLNTVWNQESDDMQHGEKQSHDTAVAIHAAVEALKILIKEDQK